MTSHEFGDSVELPDIAEEERLALASAIARKLRYLVTTTVQASVTDNAYNGWRHEEPPKNGHYTIERESDHSYEMVEVQLPGDNQPSGMVRYRSVVESSSSDDRDRATDSLVSIVEVHDGRELRSVYAMVDLECEEPPDAELIVNDPNSRFALDKIIKWATEPQITLR